MELNETTDFNHTVTIEQVLNGNVTLEQVTHYFNISIANLTNQSEETQMKLFDLYEAYRTKEREQLMIYKFVAFIVGTLIVLSNLTVVISSGLILRKGQQPKSTYLLLGNVSLADTIIGISIIFGAAADMSMSSNAMCIFQIGMLVCPAMVSIFSVGLIAIDRYIYILHGMYYQRWFTTTKVRIGIVCIWVIGVTLGFMPITGWTNKEFANSKCFYFALFPGALILLNSLLSIIPIILVAVLYSIILVKALKNVKKITGNTSIKDNYDNKGLRLYRGNAAINNSVQKIEGTRSMKYPTPKNKPKLQRSFSLNVHHVKVEAEINRASIKSKSIDDLTSESRDITNNNQSDNENIHIDDSQYDSEFSITTVDSSYSEPTNKVVESPNVNIKSRKRRHKPKEPNKWRAITVVLLTSGSFICTWVPFFITVMFFVFCEHKLTNPQCIQYRTLLRGPLAALAFINCILNPLIYAWWHKGFQRTMKAIFRKYIRNHIYKNSDSTRRNSKSRSVNL